MLTQFSKQVTRKSADFPKASAENGLANSAKKVNRFSTNAWMRGKTLV